MGAENILLKEERDDVDSFILVSVGSAAFVSSRLSQLFLEQSDSAVLTPAGCCDMDKAVLEIINQQCSVVLDQ